MTDKVWPNRNLTTTQVAAGQRPESFECRPPSYKGSDITKEAEEQAVQKFLAKFAKDQRAEDLAIAHKLVRLKLNL